MPKEGCPCKDCGHRVADPNCHGTCEDYISWAKANDEERKRKLDEKLTDFYIRDMRVLSAQKKFGKRRRTFE